MTKAKKSTILNSNEVLDQIHQWHQIRDLIVDGEILLDETVARSFSQEVFEVIIKDLKWTWFFKNEDRRLRELNLILKELEQKLNKMDGQTSKFVKVADFDSKIQHIKLLDLSRPTAESIGAKFADSKGYVNRLVFSFVGSNEEKVFDTTSYGMVKTFKAAGVKSGDECLVYSIALPDPYSERTFRHWIVQMVEPQKTVEEPEEIDNAIDESEIPDDIM